MRGPADVIHPPHRRTTAPRREPLIALILIGVSLGAGYGASRVWPLPMSSQSRPHSAGMTAIPERNDAPSPELSPPASSPSPLPSPQLATTPNLSAAQSTRSSETPSDPAPVEPVALEAPSKRSYRAIADETATPAGPTTVRSTHASRARHARRIPLSGPATPEFAPNPQPNQPSRDFMAYRSRN